MIFVYTVYIYHIRGFLSNVPKNGCHSKYLSSSPTLKSYRFRRDQLEPGHRYPVLLTDFYSHHQSTDSVSVYPSSIFLPNDCRMDPHPFVKYNPMALDKHRSYSLPFH